MELLNNIKDFFSAKMDNVPGDHSIYKEVFSTSAKIISLGVALDLILTNNGFDLSQLLINGIIGLLPLPTEIIRAAVEMLLEVGGFFIGSSIVYEQVLRHRQRVWIKNNKQLMLRGKWLHIHEKGNVRTGIVTIKQRFTTLDVKGFNVNPLAPGVGNVGRTKWSYMACRLFPTEMTGIEFFGTYAARRHGGQVKQGIHIFDTMQLDEETGMPVYLHGSFSDAFKISNEKVDDINDGKGDIYLFRMTPALDAFLKKNNIDDYNLRHILELSKKEEYAHLKDEPFIITLNEVIERIHAKQQA